MSGGGAGGGGVAVECWSPRGASPPPTPTNGAVSVRLSVRILAYP